jgi:hypothetical protein
MHHLTHTFGSSPVARSGRLPSMSPTSRLAAVLSRALRLFAQTDDMIADRYSGCGWGDETARRLLNHIIDGSRDGFFG